MLAVLDMMYTCLINVMLCIAITAIQASCFLGQLQYAYATELIEYTCT